MLRRLAAAAALVLTACDQGAVATAPIVPDAAPAAVALADVSAVGPNALAATPTFVFLAPLGAGVADPAHFDATAAPVVEVCAWNGAACTAAPIVRFSTTPSGSTLPLTIDAAAGRYEAVWSLQDTRLVSRQTYRIRVLQDAAELGAVSVDVIRGRWALTRADGTLAPLASAATLPIRFTLIPAPVPNRAPTATIAAPTPNAAFTQGLPVSFAGSGSDPEDGNLTGAALVWTSDRDGQIGTGTSFSVSTLSVGAHVVTLTATDSRSATGTATVGIVVTGTSGPGTLANGATVTGRIAANQQVDRWTFTVNAGDHAVIGLGETGTTAGFFPWLRIEGPSGTIVGSNFGSVAAQVELDALAAGTYSVLVASAGSGGTGTGDYRLTLIKAPGTLSVSAGDQGGPLINGATHAGSIYIGDVDGWTFTANAGDHAVVSVGETGTEAGFFPWLRVVGPTGTVVGSNFGSFAGQVELNGLAAGTYTVIVGSAGSGFSGAGDYLLSLVKAPGALTITAGDQGGPLTNGATHAGTLADHGDIDGWTFTAGAGDHAVVSVGEAGTSSGFFPWLRVIGPNGAVVGDNFGSFAAQVELSGLAAGAYTVIVGSAGSGFTGTGDYLVTLARTPGAITVSTGDQGGPLTNGGTHAGSIYGGDVDSWTFTASAGDRAVVSVGEGASSSGLFPWVRVVSPTGTVMGSNFGSFAAQVEFTAPAAGTYTVIVGSAGSGFTGTGDYLLSLVKGPGALSISSGDEGGPLTNGATHAGTIFNGDVDGWTFTANAGDHAVVSLGETGTSNGLFPWLRVVGPTGVAVGSNFGSFAAQVEFTAPTGGTYTVVVGSAGSGFSGTGDYLLTLVKAPGALTVSGGDQGGSLPSGAPQAGSIFNGDVDAWTFTASQGQPVVVDLGETGTSSGFFPWLRVFGPTGAVVASNFGTATAHVAFNAPTAGTYTVVVGSAGSGFTGTGDYTLVRSGAAAAARVGVLDASSAPSGGTPDHRGSAATPSVIP